MTNVETSSHHPPVAASVKRTPKKTSECETTLVKQYSATVFCSTGGNWCETIRHNSINVQTLKTTP